MPKAWLYGHREWWTGQAFCGEWQLSHLLRRVGKFKLFTNTTVLSFSSAGWEPDLLPCANTSGGVNHWADWWGVRLNTGYPVTFELQIREQTNGENHFYISNARDILKNNRCLHEIQMQLGDLYFYFLSLGTSGSEVWEYPKGTSSGKSRGPIN